MRRESPDTVPWNVEFPPDCALDQSGQFELTPRLVTGEFGRTVRPSNVDAIKRRDHTEAFGNSLKFETLVR